jgi:DNA-directed RNA polymerase specialized sigma subunit
LSASIPSPNELVTRHMDFARNTAAKTARDLPIDVDDAIQIGYEGLIQAAHRFDVAKYDPI